MPGRSPAPERQSDSPEAPPSSTHDSQHDTSLSPISEASSGYFSSSVSTATLSEAAGTVADAPADPVIPALHPSVALVEASGLKPQRTVGTRESGPADRNGVASPQQQQQPIRPLGQNSAAPRIRQSEPIRAVRGEDAEEGGRRGGVGGDALEKLEILSDEEAGQEVELPAWMRVGESVLLGGGKTGTIRYVGNTDFSEGTWVGVELDTPAGEQRMEQRSETRLCVCVQRSEIRLCVCVMADSVLFILCIKFKCRMCILP